MKQAISVCALLLCGAANGMMPFGSPLAFNSRCGQFRIYLTPIKPANQEVRIKTEAPSIVIPVRVESGTLPPLATDASSVHNSRPIAAAAAAPAVMPQGVHVKTESGIVIAVTVPMRAVPPSCQRSPSARRLEAMTPPISPSMIPATAKRPAAIEARQKWQEAMQKLRRKHK